MRIMIRVLSQASDYRISGESLQAVDDSIKNHRD